MKAIINIILVTLLSFIALSVRAQQEAMYTHYMYNTLTINPAYAGSRDVLSGTVLHRSQWVGFKGAPETQSLTIHGPIKSKKIGLGFSLTNDKIGPLRTTSVYADFAYMLRLDGLSRLSFGLKGGVDKVQGTINSLTLDEAIDPSFQNNIDSKMLLNFGFGMYYFRDRFYAGISSPRLLDNNFRTNETSSTGFFSYGQRHYYFISGALIHLSESVDFKPSTLVKLTVAAPVEADFTGTFIFQEKVLLGAMCRTGDALGLLVGFNITKEIHVGYSFDWSYGMATGQYNNGSHEIMFSYDLIPKKEQIITSPRYF